MHNFISLSHLCGLTLPQPSLQHCFAGIHLLPDDAQEGPSLTTSALSIVPPLRISSPTEYLCVLEIWLCKEL